MDVRYLFSCIAKSRTERSPSEILFFELCLEVYWIARGLISIPRLIIEELVETKRVEPLDVWMGSRNKSNFRIAWSEGVSLKLIKNIQDATGANVYC